VLVDRHGLAQQFALGRISGPLATEDVQAMSGQDQVVVRLWPYFHDPGNLPEVPDDLTGDEVVSHESLLKAAGLSASVALSAAPAFA